MDLSISEMMRLQEELFDLHKDKWPPMKPEYGKDFILYMIEEIGEVISVVKKKGNEAIMDDPNARRAFLYEMADVLMYYHDVLLRYHVTPEEIAQAYKEKHNFDMNRNYAREYEEKYNGESKDDILLHELRK